MIDKLTYDQVLEISNGLDENAKIIDEIANKREMNDLKDFTETVHNYSVYLKSVLEMNKDADLALQELSTKKKNS